MIPERVAGRDYSGVARRDSSTRQERSAVTRVAEATATGGNFRRCALDQRENAELVLQWFCPELFSASDVGAMQALTFEVESCSWAFPAAPLIDSSVEAT